MTSQKILIVDDSSTDRLNLKNVVSRANYSVITASSGVEAIAKAKSEKPDLIFMDIVMDQMDGYGACRLIQEDPDTENIPIVFVSTKSQKVDQLWAKKQGGKALVSKPYTDQDILEQIEIFC